MSCRIAHDSARAKQPSVAKGMGADYPEFIAASLTAMRYMICSI
jgi:hypothetical protein